MQRVTESSMSLFVYHSPVSNALTVKTDLLAKLLKRSRMGVVLVVSLSKSPCGQSAHAALAVWPKGTRRLGTDSGSKSSCRVVTRLRDNRVPFIF